MSRDAMGKAGHEAEMYSLIELLYQTLDSPQLLKDALAAFAAVMGATTAALHYNDQGRNLSGIEESVGLDAAAKRHYGSYFAKVDAWFERGSHLQAGWVGMGSELISDNELRRTEFYNDYLRHNDMFHQCGIVLDRDDCRFGTVTFLRGEDHSAFDRVDVARLNILVPHLQRVLRLRGRLSTLSDGMTSLGSALESFDQAVFGLDESGACQFMNGAAERIVSMGRPIYMKAGRLRLRRPKEDTKFQSLVAGSIDRAKQVFAAVGGAMLAHNGTLPPLRIVLVPYLGKAGGTHRALSALLFVGIPWERTNSRLDVLRALYQLTPMEGRLVDQIVRGHQTKVIASILAISQDTVRFHLKNVFRKTRTRRQSDLLRLILSLPGGQLSSGDEA